MSAADVQLRRDYPPVEHVFDAAAALEFADVVGAAPARSPMFVVSALPAVLEQVFRDPIIDIELASILHAEQDLDLVRLVDDGEVVQVTAEATERSYGTRRAVQVDAAVRDVDGADIALLTTTLVDMARSADRAPADRRPPAIAKGELIHRRSLPLGQELPSRYAACSGDWNPIHLDEAAALAAGLPGIVLHGLSVLSMAVSVAVEGALGGDPSPLAHVGTRFSRLAQPGGTLDVDVHGDTGDGVFALGVRIDGKPVLKGCHVRRRARG